MIITEKKIEAEEIECTIFVSLERGRQESAVRYMPQCRGLKTIVLEQKKVGGLLGSVSTVTHYAGILADETGESFSLRLKEQAERAGIEIAMEKVVEADLSGAVKRIVTEGTTYEAKAVIIAAGTMPRKLGIPGEDTFADVEQG